MTVGPQRTRSWLNRAKIVVRKNRTEIGTGVQIFGAAAGIGALIATLGLLSLIVVAAIGLILIGVAIENGGR